MSDSCGMEHQANEYKEKYENGIHSIKYKKNPIDMELAKQQARHKHCTLGGRQTYANILKRLKGTGQLYEDPDFPANDFSLGPKRRSEVIKWKRPQEISASPRLFVDGASRLDIKQGRLRDCWLLAATSSLTAYPALLHRVVPAEDQGFEAATYVGAFHFNVWHYGRWIPVVVDDRLPTWGDRLLFASSTNRDEFWTPLLEKAYAKICGSYEALTDGLQAEAMEDLTGGLCESLTLVEPVTDDLFKRMRRNLQKCCLMGSSIDVSMFDGGSIDPQPGQGIETRIGQGLVAGHAYSITDVKELNSSTRLVRVRNPWANGSEWTGSWSDSSAEWNKIAPEKRKELGLVFQDDGEFWMAFEDFVKSFTALETCYLGPGSLDESVHNVGAHKQARWEMTEHSGAWVRNVNAGGCLNFKETHHLNPQYTIEILDPDENDDENIGTIIVGLMQVNMRRKQLQYVPIGYTIHKLTEKYEGPLTSDFFKWNKHIAISKYINQREVCQHHKLPPGRYVIVPTTHKPNKEAEFLLRIYTEKPAASEEIDAADNMTGTSEEIMADMEKMQEDFEEMRKRLSDKFFDIANGGAQLNSFQLTTLLNETMATRVTNFRGFSVDDCYSMIAFSDKNGTGKMEFYEFEDLWHNLSAWKLIFDEQDRAKSGAIDAMELRKLLKTAGLTLNNRLYMSCINRYTSPVTGTFSFENFCVCIIRLKSFYADSDRGDQRKNYRSYTYV